MEENEIEKAEPNRNRSWQVKFWVSEGWFSETSAKQRGAVIMEPKIEIYDDYCVDMDSNDIQTILSQITALVTDAVLRATAQKKDEDDAA